PATAPETARRSAHIAHNIQSVRDVLDANSAKTTEKFNERWNRLAGYFEDISKDIAAILLSGEAQPADVADTNVVNLAEYATRTTVPEELRKSIGLLIARRTNLAEQWVRIEGSFGAIILTTARGADKIVSAAPEPTP